MLEMCFNCDYCEEQNGDYFCTNNESEYVGEIDCLHCSFAKW